jgi:glutaconate CoA-transferase subunit B
MTGSPATLHETIVVALARDLADEEVGYTGLVTGGAAAIYGTSIPVAAMELARLTHAPGLTLLLAGWSHNPDLSRLDALPEQEFDARLCDLPAEAQMVAYPDGWAIRRGDISFGFSSAVQVDVAGNINSVCVGDYRRPRVRLVGPILQPEHMTLFGREYVMMPHHERRNFVPRVDYVSGVGFPGGRAGRRRLGLDRGGPAWVITPRCIFDFDEDAGRIRVRSIHPGVPAAEVQAATGFDLGDLARAPVTAAPTAAELDLLRHQVDPRGILLARPA